MSGDLTWLIALAALALGALFSWLYFRAQSAGLRVQAAGVSTQLAETNRQLDQTRTALADREKELAGLRATIEAERRSAAEKLAELLEAKARFTEAFDALSAAALKKNNESFLTLAQETLARFQQGAQGDLAQRQQAIDALVKPIRESLEKVDTRIGDIEKTRTSAYASLSEQLKSLALAQGALQTETTRLSTALSATRTAGTWGELQLRRVVELAGMVEHCDFSVQEVAGGQRPDLVVRLPLGQHIVVDAKAPTDAYREAASATDPKIRAEKLAEHAAKVRGHVDALTARAYWEQFQPSPEFVVLFLPGDQFLSAALEADPNLVDRAIRGKVLLATPSTLIALLKAAAYGWRQEAVSQNAEEIARLGRELYDRIATFAEHLEKAGRSLDAATRSFNSAIGSFEGTLLPGARKFQELGARGAKELTAPAPIEHAVREVTKRS